MIGGGWRHREAEPSCGFVDESFGPAGALERLGSDGGARARVRPFASLVHSPGERGALDSRSRGQVRQMSPGALKQIHDLHGLV